MWRMMLSRPWDRVPQTSDGAFDLSASVPASGPHAKLVLNFEPALVSPSFHQRAPVAIKSPGSYGRHLSKEMPARTRKVKHDDLTREKIRTSQLLNRLHDHVFGKGDKTVEVSPTQMKAIEILLRKSLPDLSAITLSGDPNNPIEVRSVATDAERFTSDVAGLASRIGESGAAEPTQH